jgi:hypothetical protein
MHRRKALLSLLLAIGICLVFSSGCATSKVPPSEQRFSFAVLADLQSGTDTWKNALLEVRDRKANPDPAFTSAELILIAGDMLPLASRYEDYLHVFANENTRPVFLPVIGNHEFNDGGIYQVNAATAGSNVIVQVQVEGENLLFRVLQAKNGANKPFAEIDKWSMVHHP